MHPSKRLSLIVLIILLAALTLGLSRTDRSLAAGEGSEKIEPALLDRLLAEGQADYLVRFAEQADLSVAYGMAWSERGWFVYNTLTETAQRSQARAQAYLSAQGVTYRSFFAGNDLYVYAGNLEQAAGLARLGEVASLFIPPVYTITPFETVNPASSVSWAGELLANRALVTAGLPEADIWGIPDANANDFWATFSVRGAGIKVANIDTGVRYTHDALEHKYACEGTAHTNCWLDPDGVDVAPYDPNGHGTHTMGTMVGYATGYPIGMAPDAKWIACQGCDGTSCGSGDIATCANWILAPGGTPDNRPNIVNNSWGSTSDGDAWFRPYVEAWRAAGIFPAFSAGNNGPDCDTLGDPGSYQVSFASTGHDISGVPYTKASRGPSYFGDEPYTKPNLSAPGVGIWSSYHTYDDTYSMLSGTSMASPHTAGAVALLWSCNPALIGMVDGTFQLLQNNTRIAPDGSCGAPVDGEGNFTYGYGYLDVWAAGSQVCGGAITGELVGHVYDTNGTPLGGASIKAVSADHSGQTLADPTGAYTMTLATGTYTVTASLNGYLDQTATGVPIAYIQTTPQDFYLPYLGLWTAQIPSLCSNLTRFDAEFFPATGLVYIPGGRYVYLNESQIQVDTTVGMIYAFNPLTGECSDTGADMPIPVSNYTLSLFEYNGAEVLCTFGGRTAGGAQTSAVQCYNPQDNVVAQIASLPAAYTGYSPGAQVVLNNKVYLFGGLNPTTAPYNLALTYRYDPLDGSFTPLGNLSLARAYIMAAVVDGHIYAFGGDVYEGGTELTPQIRTEVMLDPEGAGTWNDAAIADLPLAAGEGRAFGFDSNSGYQLAGKIAITGLPQFPGASYEVITYDPLSDTYDLNYPNLNIARRNQAAVFIPLSTANPSDGLPGMWVLGGFCTGGACGGDLQPYGIPEFIPVPLVKHFFVPFIFK